ncbi:chromate transport protein ChrA [Sphingobium xenophagum]|uniref:Chromate transport protein ChrA n=1 Tax=Sphingobium xenophagum TaxID=121428 RepID=A0ABU1WZP7_SPHXE|nr:chromate transport protein ChrA [Sphingobium xenophagum]
MARSFTVSLKSRVSAISLHSAFSFGRLADLVFIQQHRSLIDIGLLPFFRPTYEQDDKLMPFLGEIESIARSPVDPIFSEAAAYAVLAYVAQEAVGTFGWLQPGEMLDGLGMAETTPGPLIMVTQFVGFLAAFRDSGTLPPLLAATLGAILTTWITFVPCFLWIFAGAPFIERLRGNTALSAALTAITAAVVGVIFNLAIWFAIHTLFGQTMLVRSWTGTFDVPILRSVNLVAVVLALAAAIAIFRFRLGVLTVLGGCAALGAVYKLAL